VASRGIRDIDRLLQLLTDSRIRLPELAREMLGVLAAQLREVAAHVGTVEAQLLAWHRSNDVSRRHARTRDRANGRSERDWPRPFRRRPQCRTYSPEGCATADQCANQLRSRLPNSSPSQSRTTNRSPVNA
jgi:hypothetical protein